MRKCDGSSKDPAGSETPLKSIAQINSLTQIISLTLINFFTLINSKTRRWLHELQYARQNKQATDEVNFKLLIVYSQYKQKHFTITNNSE